MEPLSGRDGTVGAPVTITRCGHLFHLGCIAQWGVVGRTTCPLCRKSLV
jgi:hypothetical protein